MKIRRMTTTDIVRTLYCHRINTTSTERDYEIQWTQETAGVPDEKLKEMVYKLADNIVPANAQPTDFRFSMESDPQRNMWNYRVRVTAVVRKVVE